MSDLFRHEAIAHKSQRFHGAIVLTRTWTFPVLTLFLGSLVALVVLFALFFGFTRKETVNGVITPDLGLIGLVAPQSGIVAKVHVKEGQQVGAGDILFVLSGERASALGATHAAINEALATRMRSLRGELAQHQAQAKLKRNELDERLLSLIASQRLLDEDIALRRRKVQLARDAAARLNELAEGGAVSTSAAREKQAELIEQESRLAAAGRERMDLQRTIGTLSASSADLPLQTARDTAQIHRAINELQQQATESEVRREVLVRAGQAGRVAGIVVNPGQPVTPDQRIASLVPAGSTLEAELYAPTRAAGFVRVGTEVLLRYDAYPYQKFGQFHGRVREISLSAIPLNELLRTGSASTEPVYRIRVRLDRQDVSAAGAAHALKPGMQLSASLVLERRTLAQWVLAPLFAMTGRL